jgi:hypothetical protein
MGLIVNQKNTHSVLQRETGNEWSARLPPSGGEKDSSRTFGLAPGTRPAFLNSQASTRRESRPRWFPKNRFDSLGFGRIRLDSLGLATTHPAPSLRAPPLPRTCGFYFDRFDSFGLILTFRSPVSGFPFRTIHSDSPRSAPRILYTRFCQRHVRMPSDCPFETLTNPAFRKRPSNRHSR